MENNYRGLFLDYLSIERGVSRATVLAYQSALNHYLNYLNANDLSVLTSRGSDVRLFLQSMTLAGKQPSTISQMTTVLRTFYKFLLSEGILEISPMEKLHPIKRLPAHPETVTQQQIDQLLATIQSDRVIGNRDFFIFSLLFTTGIRVSELCNLTFNQLNRSMHSIRVVGKGDKERQVLYPETLDPIIDDYLAAFREIHFNSRYNSTLFLTPSGNKLTRQLIYQRLQYYRKEAGIKARLSPHRLRHAFATHLLANGADVRSVQELLGHQSIATTQIYLDVADHSIREAYLKLHQKKKGEE